MTEQKYELSDAECPDFDPSAEPAPSGPLCEKEWTETDTYGGETERQCGHQGTITVPSGRLLCEDHAGELGYGPKQAEYGYDPDDGHDKAATLPTGGVSGA